MQSQTPKKLLFFCKQTSRIVLVVAGIIFFSLVVPLSYRVAATANIAQGYSSLDKELVAGMTVALAPDSTTEKQQVERASVVSRDKVVGVVTTLENSLLTITSEAAQVHVATSGEVKAFSSDLNGTIKKGDFVSVSPLKGVLMHAEPQSTWVVGTALEDSSLANASSQKIKNTDGTERTVSVNTLAIDVDIKQVDQGRQQPSFLLLFGKSLTGKAVSQLQVAAAFIIFFLLLMVEGSIVYGAVYSSIVALGRNPLSKSVIYRDLAQTIVLVFVILAVGLGAVYVVLWV